MRTKLFEWAERQGFGIADLAGMTGYSERHLLRIRDEGFPVSEAFQARVVLRMGDWSRSLFLPSVSEPPDSLAGQTATAPAQAPAAAQERDDGPSEYSDAPARRNGPQSANLVEPETAA